MSLNIHSFVCYCLFLYILSGFSPSVHPSIHPSVHPSTDSTTYLSVCLYVCLFDCLSVCLSVCLFACLFTSTYLFFFLSFLLFFLLFFFLSFSLSVYYIYYTMFIYVFITRKTHSISSYMSVRHTDIRKHHISSPRDHREITHQWGDSYSLHFICVTGGGEQTITHWWYVAVSRSELVTYHTLSVLVFPQSLDWSQRRNRPHSPHCTTVSGFEPVTFQLTIYCFPRAWTGTRRSDVDDRVPGLWRSSRWDVLPWRSTQG